MRLVEAPVDTLQLSNNALTVLERRYLLRDREGRVIEKPEELFWRVANNIAKAERKFETDEEKWAERFHTLMASLTFLPNSPTLMNAGTDIQQLSACFVLPVGDSIDEIFTSVTNAAKIHKSGGGTGFSFSRLRPRGDIVGSTGGVASGPTSFMTVFNAATNVIKQGSKRRGANMGILRVDHPDILEFIHCKDDLSQFTNFNISIAITDVFMKAVEKGEKYGLINPRSGLNGGELDARDVFSQIAYAAWATGEPGLFFIDRANANNPVPHIYEIESTNPCGEQDLGPNDVCNLGSINVEKFCTEKGRFHWEDLADTVFWCVRFLDNVIEMNKFPLLEIERMATQNRRIGLGIMGFARALFRQRIQYDSEEGITFAKRLMSFIREQAIAASYSLSLERGTFPSWKGSRWEDKGIAMRNSYILTIAPTGTLSMIADTSGGCEPEFALVWYKHVMDGDKLPYALGYFTRVAKEEGFWHEGLLDEVITNRGSVQGLESVPEKWQKIFRVSFDIEAKWHVRMQAAFQQYVDSQVSKTINLPPEATIDDVKQAYILAYDLGCRGITVYRDGAREDQVLNVGISQ